MQTAQTKQVEAIYDRLCQYRKDPIGFFRDILSVRSDYIWPKMVELAQAIRDHQFVAVRAGNSVSKTYTMGRIIPWFKTCWQPSTVISTAPSDNQIRNQLWREVHAAYAAAKVPLGGRMHVLSWDVKPSDDILEHLGPEDREKWEKNFAIGFTTSPDTQAEHTTKMQGWHNEHVLVVIDEACGILPQIWRTIMETLITDENCRVVAIGNPTDPECDFTRVCRSSDPEKNEGNQPYISDEGWYVVTIAATDTPNYQRGERVIPGLASRQFVDRIIKKYGPDGDGTRYRIKGLFPTYREGTYYGSALAKARKDHRVARFSHETAAPVYTFSDFGDMYTATIFVQFLRGRIRLIGDYWDNEGLGLPAWAKMCQMRLYVYGGHFVGPDFNTSRAKSFQTGKTTKDIAAELGFDFTPVVRHDFDDGIEATRSIWPLLDIDEGNCSTFIKAAAGYGKTKNNALSTDEEAVYHDSTARTWHRHMMDALRHLAVAYRRMEIGGEMIGDLSPLAEEMDREFARPARDADPLSLTRL